MDDIDVTRMSSKGQVVIPQELREDFHEGEKLIVIRAGKQLILKKVKDFKKNIEEDLKFAKRTEEAWKRYENGEFKEKSAEEFLEDLEQW